MKNIDKDVETNQQSEQVSNSPLSTFEKIRSVMQYLSFSVGVVLIALRIKPQDTIPNMITLYGLGPFLILAAMVSAVYPTLQQIKLFSFVILALQALAIILLFSTSTEPISVKELVVVYPLIIVSHLTHFSIYAMRIIVGVSCGAVSSPSGDVGSNLIFVFAHLDCAMTLLWHLILYSRSLSSRSKSRLAKPSAPHIKVNSFGRHDSIGAGNAGTSIDVMTMSNFSRAPVNGTDAKKPSIEPCHQRRPHLGHQPLLKTDQKLLANQQYQELHSAEPTTRLPLPLLTLPINPTSTVEVLQPTHSEQSKHDVSDSNINLVSSTRRPYSRLPSPTLCPLESRDIVNM
jgi:hypothetical protein